MQQYSASGGFADNKIAKERAPNETQNFIRACGVYSGNYNRDGADRVHKTPAGAESSGGSGESMSTGQGGEPSVNESAAESGENGELYEFVASEKAAAQVQGIAEVLGGYDFVGLSGVQST